MRKPASARQKSSSPILKDERGERKQVARFTQLRALFLARDRAPAGFELVANFVGAGFREMVLVVQGSSARMASGCKDAPVDAAIVGIVDTVDVTN